MTLEECEAILKEVRFPNIHFEPKTYDLDPRSCYISAIFHTIDIGQRQPVAIEACSNLIDLRKATEDEILKEAMAAVMTLFEHEAGELFSYKGRAVFNPHDPINLCGEYCLYSRLHLVEDLGNAPEIPTEYRPVPLMVRSIRNPDQKWGTRIVPLIERLGPPDLLILEAEEVSQKGQVPEGEIEEESVDAPVCEK